MASKSKHERMIEAEERGDKIKAEKCYEKAQFWLDRYNALAGNN